MKFDKQPGYQNDDNINNTQNFDDQSDLLTDISRKEDESKRENQIMLAKKRQEEKQ